MPIEISPHRRAYFTGRIRLTYTSVIEEARFLVSLGTSSAISFMRLDTGSDDNIIIM